ncbi:hypothetical protein GGI35DRAFT_492123 [Trichoderma velutinum]
MSKGHRVFKIIRGYRQRLMMIEQTQTLPQKSRTVQKSFVGLIRYLEDNEVPNVISSSEITDALERFALWAGNLGALREPTSKLSLDYRLAEAPEIRNQIHRQLDYLLEAIDDVATVVQERQADHDITEDDINVEYFDALDDPQDGPSEEIRMNVELISESLKTLFRIAVLRAIHFSNFTFSHTFDIDYVEEKYPKLKTKEQSWLAERLGKAIARRRQFIKYCRDHRDRLALDDENIEAESATTVIQSSKATTLQLEKIQTESNFAVDDYEDDVVSILSTSTTTDVLSTLALPRLVDLSKDGEAFECPICFTLKSLKGEQSWRLHAFNDLKPYSCTIGGAECDSLAFQDRNSWFQHELDCHRSQYACSLCADALFRKRANLRSHISNSHGQFPEHQLKIMEDAGRTPPINFEAHSCPFCDDWSVALQTKGKLKSQEIEGQSIRVRPDRFKRHVAAHLEQLAIFAIPRATEDNTKDGWSSVNSFGSTVDSSDFKVQEAPESPEKGWLEAEQERAKIAAKRLELAEKMRRLHVALVKETETKMERAQLEVDMVRERIKAKKKAEEDRWRESDQAMGRTKETGLLLGIPAARKSERKVEDLAQADELARLRLEATIKAESAAKAAAEKKVAEEFVYRLISGQKASENQGERK